MKNGVTEEKYAATIAFGIAVVGMAVFFVVLLVSRCLVEP